MDIFYYNTPIYREILLKFLQFTEKYYVNRTPFHFRRRAEAFSTPFKGVQHAFQRCSAWLVLARLKNAFIRRSEPCYIEKSGTPQHNTVSKIGLIRVNFKCNNYSMSLLITSRKNNIRSIH